MVWVSRVSRRGPIGKRFVWDFNLGEPGDRLMTRDGFPAFAGRQWGRLLWRLCQLRRRCRRCQDGVMANAVRKMRIRQHCRGLVGVFGGARSRRPKNGDVQWEVWETSREPDSRSRDLGRDCLARLPARLGGKPGHKSGLGAGAESSGPPRPGRFSALAHRFKAYLRQLVFTQYSAA